MDAFKAYDIRGKWNKDLDAELVYKIGYFLPELLKAKKILVGRDVRLSSDEAFNALSGGITDAGADVFDAGLSTTPMIYWGTGKMDFDASVMITASHNPKSHNGLKFSAKGVLPVGYGNGLNRIEKLIREGERRPKQTGGSVQKIELAKDYLDFLLGFRENYRGLKIAIDNSNGMAGLFTEKLFGTNITYLNNLPDGNFPGHNPNPLEPENQEQIKQAVRENACDIGLIFDGDADRVMFIDEKGHFVSPDLIIALLGHYFLEKKKGETVVHDIRTSKAVGEYLEQNFGAKVEIWKVGRAFGATKLRELDGIYGGELAGHYYFRDFYYSDSGLLAALIVLNVVARFHEKGLSFSELMAGISTYANTGEINFKLEQKQQAMDAVKDYFMEKEIPLRFLDFDGYRLDFANWWFNIRPSNTEPYLRFLAEAEDRETLDSKTKIIFNLISRFE
ncbi:MAG: phosphomannomutase/phosphoglucomutase [Bacteroidales bacterium]|nr:phosphomannomutase/phosphoglucomutase [Bacteroidales bacterium]